MDLRNETLDIWNELLTFDRKEPEQAVRFVAEKIMPLIGACRAAWVGSVRDKDYLGCPVSEMLNDWVVIGLEYFILDPAYAPDEETTYSLYMETRAKYGADSDIVTNGALKGAGKSRAHLRSDSLSDDDWLNHWCYKDFNKKNGVGDVLHIVVNLDQECESWLVFYKPDGEDFFTEEDKLLAQEIVMGAAEWFRRILLFRGAVLPSKRVLSPQEQRVLQLLIKGKRDQEIADQCGFSVSTARSHTASIYRKLSVGGKVELMSLFV